MEIGNNTINKTRNSIIIAIMCLMVVGCATTEKKQIPKGMTEEQIAELEEIGIRITADGDITYFKFEESENEVWIKDEVFDEDGKNSLHITKVSVSEDPICALKSSVLNKPDSIVIVSPNPTSSSATIKLLSNVINRGYNLSMSPLTIDFQLLYNERIIHQWTINNYYYNGVTISEEYLRESGSYMLVCNFIGPTGCTASYSTTFMVVKR